MAEDAKKEEGGFKVSDRRWFTEEGELRQGAPVDEPRILQSADNLKQEHREEGRDEDQSRGDNEAALDFMSFLFSLYTSALIQLGDVPDPETRRRAGNIEAARQTIDLLDILRRKTKGNLSSDEERFLDQALYELRMSFLAKTKS